MWFNLKTLSFVVATCHVIFLQDLRFGQPMQYNILYRFYVNVFINFITKINEYKSMLWSLRTIYNLICWNV